MSLTRKYDELLRGACRGALHCGVTAALVHDPLLHYEADAVHDSHVRFIGGVWLGLGVLMFAGSLAFQRLRTVLVALTAMTFVGGVARLGGDPTLLLSADVAPSLFLRDRRCASAGPVVRQGGKTFGPPSTIFTWLLTRWRLPRAARPTRRVRLLISGVRRTDDSKMVRAVGIEPTLLSEPDFESGASTSSATPATDAPGRVGMNRGRTSVKARPRQSRPLSRCYGAGVSTSVPAPSMPATVQTPLSTPSSRSL